MSTDGLRNDRNINAVDTQVSQDIKSIDSNIFDPSLPFCDPHYLQTDSDRALAEHPTATNIDDMNSNTFGEKNMESPELVSVKHRFQNAQDQQIKRQAERLARFKQDPRQYLLHSAAQTTTPTNPLNLSNSMSSHSPSETKTLSQMLLQEDDISPNTLWSKTVHSLQEKEKMKAAQNMENIKKQKYKQFVDDSHVVTRRIDLWENYSVQLEPSAEELAMMWKIIKKYLTYLPKYKQLIGTTIISPNIAETFILGSTRIFEASCFGKDTFDYLQLQFKQARIKYLGLTCGVYNIKSAKPPIRVVTMAVKDQHGVLYIAITIRAQRGVSEHNPLIYGNRKIVVYEQNTKQFLFAQYFSLIYSLENMNLDDWSIEEHANYLTTFPADMTSLHTDDMMSIGGGEDDPEFLSCVTTPILTQDNDITETPLDRNAKEIILTETIPFTPTIAPMTANTSTNSIHDPEREVPLALNEITAKHNNTIVHCHIPERDQETNQPLTELKGKIDDDNGVVYPEQLHFVIEDTDEIDISHNKDYVRVKDISYLLKPQIIQSHIKYSEEANLNGDNSTAVTAQQETQATIPRLSTNSSNYSINYVLHPPLSLSTKTSSFSFSANQGEEDNNNIDANGRMEEIYQKATAAYEKKKSPKMHSNNNTTSLASNYQMKETIMETNLLDTPLLINEVVTSSSSSSNSNRMSSSSRPSSDSYRIRSFSTPVPSIMSPSVPARDDADAKTDSDLMGMEILEHKADYVSTTTSGYEEDQIVTEDDVLAALPDTKQAMYLYTQKQRPHVMTKSWYSNSQPLPNTKSPHSTQAFLQLPIAQIDNICSCEKLFVAAINPSSSSSSPTTSSSTTVISNGFDITKSLSKCVVEDNKVCEWIRGVTISGWIWKYPSRTHGIGPYHRRFFVLYDNYLSYYSYPPTTTTTTTGNTQGEKWTPNTNNTSTDHSLYYHASYRPKGIPITEDTTIEIVSNFFHRRCIKISTPSHGSGSSGGSTASAPLPPPPSPHVSSSAKILTNPIFRNSFRSTTSSLSLNTTNNTANQEQKDVLYISFGAYSAMESTWLEALENTIRLQSNKRMSLSTTIKTLWFHEEPNYSLVSVDARIGDFGYSKVGLFHLAIQQQPRHRKQQGIDDADSALKGIYIVDIISNEKDCQQLEVVFAQSASYNCSTTAEGKKKNEEVNQDEQAPTEETRLQCIKIYGDMFLLGGIGGYIGIGIVNPTTKYSNQKKHIMSFSCQEITNMRQYLSSSTFKDNKPAAVATNARASSIPGHHYTARPSSPMGMYYPHSPISTIQYFAYAQKLDIIVACDNEHIFSFWLFEREQQLTSEDLYDENDDLMNDPVSSPISPPSLQKQQQRNALQALRKPEFQSAFSLAATDPYHLYTEEKVLAMYFLIENEYLMVSTNKRLLLLAVAYRHHSGNPSNYYHHHNIRHRSDSGGNVSQSSGSGSSGSGNGSGGGSSSGPNSLWYEEYHDGKFGVIGYVEIDKVDNPLTQYGLFALNLIDPLAQQQHHNQNAHDRNAFGLQPSHSASFSSTVTTLSPSSRRGGANASNNLHSKSLNNLMESPQQTHSSSTNRLFGAYQQQHQQHHHLVSHNGGGSNSNTSSLSRSQSMHLPLSHTQTSSNPFSTSISTVLSHRSVSFYGRKIIQWRFVSQPIDTLSSSISSSSSSPLVAAAVSSFPSPPPPPPLFSPNTPITTTRKHLLQHPEETKVEKDDNKRKLARGNNNEGVMGVPREHVCMGSRIEWTNDYFQEQLKRIHYF